ncbi:MAG: hypothetical protein QXF80_06785 [Thermoplasmatales archaeon]
MQREVEVEDENGNKVTVILRQLTYAEYTDILKNNVKMEYINAMSKTYIDFVKYKHDLVLMSVVNKDKVDVDKLPMKSGLKVEEVALELNGVSGEVSFQ